MTLTDTQIEDLAKPLIDILVKFYENPKNEKELKKWLLCVEKNRRKTT